PPWQRFVFAKTGHSPPGELGADPHARGYPVYPWEGFPGSSAESPGGLSSHDRGWVYDLRGGGNPMSVDLETATGKQVDVGTKPTTNGSLRVLAAVLAVLLLGTGYVIGNASKTQAPPVKRARDQAHPYYNVSAAIALVAGITRPQDGLVFGEWARLHASKICPSLVPASRWGIQAQNQPYGWYIYINVISGPYNSKSPCANDSRLDHPLYLA